MRVFNPVMAEMDKMDIILNSNGIGKNKRIGALEFRFLKRFERAIISVKINKCNLIISDDTPRKNDEDWRRHRENIMRILKRHGFDKSKDNLFFTEEDGDKGGKGSSMAQWKLRKHFLKLTENDQEAFAVLLDQDDVLYDNAIKKVSRRMSSDSIVVSKFSIVGETERNIIADGGRVHNYLTGSGKCIMKVFPHKLSTIGWTKAYSRNAMNCMVNDFEKFFEKKEDINSFFGKYRAYEDFLDFYMLIRKDISLRACTQTHMYYKHADSITAKPNINAFMVDRATMLATLADMCEFNSTMLKNGWERKLTNFLYRKIDEIEGILKKNRDKATDGDCMMKPFINETYEGWFVECVSSITNNIYIAQAIEKWKESKKKEDNIIDIIGAKFANRIKNHDENTDIKFKRTTTDRQLQKNKINCRIVISCIILVFIMSILQYYIDIEWNGCRLNFKLKQINGDENINVVEKLGVFVTIISTFYSVMLELRKRLEIKVDEETSLRKLYFAEFNDLIRHLKANLLVIIEIRLRMRSDKSVVIPMNIHFENLKWPDKSILFMEKVATIIDKSKVDDFSRLRLNIRNMNNSAEWLKNYCNSSFYKKEKMEEMIDWEIWRMMAYYVNFLYMRDNNFNFPTLEQLDMYLSYPETKEILYNLFLSVDDRNDKMNMVAKFIEMYYNDRRERRNVVFQ